MRRLAETCGVSLLLYMALFACALDRPLSLGAVRVRIEAALEAARGIDQPKLVILAGSNGPYSHRCATIGPLIGRPCINAGVAVGVGLDYLFTRWEPLLHPGDLVYLPLEEAQYSRSAAATALGPDAAIMLRHDRATLRLLPLGRQISALFASDLRAVLMSLIETTLAHEGFHDPRAAVSGESNQWGDHVGHTLALAEPNQAALAAVVPYHPTANEIQTGYGSVLVSGFLRWADRNGVTAIGGLPTGFADSPISEDAVAAIEAVYRTNRAAFVTVPNRSRYPRSDFFDSQDHLHETAQIAHSIAVAAALAGYVPSGP